MKDIPDRHHVVKSSHHPLLFTLRKEDTRIPIEVALKQAAIAQGSEIHILKETGHMGLIEDKDYTIKTIKYFAQKCFTNPQH